MNTLTLPSPAAELWSATRDTLTKLGRGPERWKIRMGGGTVLAARIGHRESTDIDLVVVNKKVLGARGLLEEGDLPDRLGGREVTKNPGQIKIEMPAGVIDLSTAPVIPSVGSRTHTISGHPQDVLSNTQIMRGKMSRADKPGPVRDVYDVVRTSMDDATAGDLTAAYNLLIDIEQDAIESAWIAMDTAYEEDARDQLRLTEPPCADLSTLGSTAARILHDHRLERVVVAIDEGRLRVDRTTRHGRTFTDFPGPEDPGENVGALGVYACIEEHGGRGADILEHAVGVRNAGGEGVIFDTAGQLPIRRLESHTPSGRRTGTPPSGGGPGPPQTPNAAGKEPAERPSDATADAKASGPATPAPEAEHTRE